MNFNISELVYCAIVRLCKANRAQLNFILRRAARNSAFGKKKKKTLFLSVRYVSLFHNLLQAFSAEQREKRRGKEEKGPRPSLPLFFPWSNFRPRSTT